jgi:hypothetical protein
MPTILRFSAPAACPLLYHRTIRNLRVTKLLLTKPRRRISLPQSVSVVALHRASLVRRTRWRWREERHIARAAAFAFRATMSCKRLPAIFLYAYAPTHIIDPLERLLYRVGS